MFKKSLYNSVWFALKTIILFGFFYEFVPIFSPNPSLSSRKIGFVVVLFYFLIKRYSVRPFLKDKRFMTLFYLTIFCIFYSFILMSLNQGTGEYVIVWYVFFLAYSLIGTILFAGFFNWKYDELLKAIALVTLFQSIWCILTFYNDAIRLLNSTLFVVSEEENIDFLDTTRLRSIGAAGAGLSVRLALSSFSFIYFILKRKYVFFYSAALIICFFATFLSGTTGILIYMVLMPMTLYLVMKGRKISIITSLLIFIPLLYFYNNSSSFFDDKQYDDLTYKLKGFFEDKSEDRTVQALSSMEKVSGISSTTIMGTGFSRGKLSSGEVCYHDGGYIRNYFGIGLIMTIVLFLILYRVMLRMCKGIRPPIRYLLFLYTLICVVIEVKEPFIFSYVPFFVFMILLLAEKQQKVMQK